MPQPSGDLHVTVELVAALLRDQRPDLAALAVVPFAHGWDNKTFALGDRLLVRVPRREAAVALLGHEQRWLATVAAGLRVSVPLPVFAGRPSPLFPYPWSVVPRLRGTVLASVPLAQRGPAMEGLARVMIALHRPAAHDAPRNPFRGVALMTRQEVVHRRLLDHPELGAGLPDRWLNWSAAPPYPGPPVWLHGDPHPLNLLVGRAGRLAAVLDWGDLTAGDPASDLASGWLAFNAGDRERFLLRCLSSGAYDEAVRTRARAWALALASAFAVSGDPALAPIARHALAELAGQD